MVGRRNALFQIDAFAAAIDDRKARYAIEWCQDAMPDIAADIDALAGLGLKARGLPGPDPVSSATTTRNGLSESGMNA